MVLSGYCPLVVLSYGNATNVRVQRSRTQQFLSDAANSKTLTCLYEAIRLLCVRVSLRSLRRVAAIDHQFATSHELRLL
jgi:hypothetical protein